MEPARGAGRTAAVHAARASETGDPARGEASAALPRAARHRPARRHRLRGRGRRRSVHRPALAGTAGHLRRGRRDGRAGGATRTAAARGEGGRTGRGDDGRDREPPGVPEHPSIHGESPSSGRSRAPPAGRGRTHRQSAASCAADSRPVRLGRRESRRLAKALLPRGRLAPSSRGISTRVQPGAAQALYEDLVRRLATPLYRLAFRLCGDAQRAEDLVQEAYFHAWRSIESLEDPAAARPWLVTILRRRGFRALRRARREPPAIDLDRVDAAAHPLPGPDLDRVERQDALQRAIDLLDPAFREPFVLVFCEGLSCREVAELLDVPLGTVLSRVHRARMTLRTILRPEQESVGDEARPRREASGGRT